MATKTVNVNEGAVIAAPKKNKSIKALIRDNEAELAKALPAVITPERFARIATTAITRTPELGVCTPASFMGALLTSAQLGLEPNTPLGQAYLIPYNNHKTGEKECQFQLGYRGMIELAHRSGELKDLSAQVVYENDTFEYELGLEPKLKHVPAMSNRGNIAWVYAVYHLNSGGFGFEVMSYDDIEQHRRKYSKARNSPWDTSWEAMAKKTVIKRALKYAPLSSDFAKAAIQDEGVVEFRDNGDGEMDLFQQERFVEADVEITEEQQAIDLETGEVK